MCKANPILPDISHDPQCRSKRRGRLLRRQRHVEKRNARPPKLFKSHPVGLVARDVRLKSRPIEGQSDLRYVPLNSAVVKLPDCQQDWNWFWRTLPAVSSRHNLLIINHNGYTPGRKQLRPTENKLLEIFAKQSREHKNPNAREVAGPSQAGWLRTPARHCHIF